MKNGVRRVLAALTVLVTSVTLAACSFNTPEQEASSTPSSTEEVITVIASTNTWGSLAKELGGKYVDVTSILNNTNNDAHDYEPTSNDISKFQHAQVAVVNGAGYDEWAVKAAEQSKAIVIDAANEAGKKTGDNPHVWFSATARIKTADAISAAYEKIMPEHKAQFEELNTQWNEQEAKLDEQMKTIAKTDDNMPYGATESVGQYLADDMGLHDLTPTGYKQATANESEPTPADIKDFTNLLKKGDMHMLFVNTQEQSSMSDQLVDAANSGNVPVVDLTEQMPSNVHTLHEWMQQILDQIKEAQSAKKNN